MQPAKTGRSNSCADWDSASLPRGILSSPMSKESPGDDIKTRVEALIDGASVDSTNPVSVVNRTTFTESLAQDSGAAVDQATADRERLAKVEAQTRVLADAVIAIADTAPSLAVAPAVKAVKAEMKDEGTASVAPPPGKYFDGRRNN